MPSTKKDNDSWRELLSDFVGAWPSGRWRDVGVVIGCSGGADSVALLRAVCASRNSAGGDTARGFVVAAHFNHAIRGNESDRDQAFVETLAMELGVKAEIGRSSTIASDESTLRSARLDFLETTAKRLGARYVALAHSADDNVETVLHHLMRGTGPVGLAGIRSSRPFGRDLVLVRPLLSVRRDLIRRALESIGQPWQEDSSNGDIAYRRNWIRHELMPLIESQYPCGVEAMSRAVDAQRTWCETMDRFAADWLSKHWIDDDRSGTRASGSRDAELRYDRETDASIVVLATQHLWAVMGWPCGGMSRQHWRRLTETIRHPWDDRYTLPGGIEVRATPATVNLCDQRAETP